MITNEYDIVEGDLPLWLRGTTFTILSDRPGIFFREARQRTVNRTGSKMKCVELCNFHYCCAFSFCLSMKEFEFFGACRATRQRHFKTSSTGKENGVSLWDTGK